jgi:hypothetical protein
VAVLLVAVVQLLVEETLVVEPVTHQAVVIAVLAVVLHKAAMSPCSTC